MKVIYATDGGDRARNALTLFARAAASDKSRVRAVTVVRLASLANLSVRYFGWPRGVNAIVGDMRQAQRGRR
jgi:hypothetical protein